VVVGRSSEKRTIDNGLDNRVTADGKSGHRICLRRRADLTSSVRRKKLYQSQRDKWVTVVVERKVKQAVSEIGANARVRRPQAIKSA
jgi:cation diffusion facilitator CzcD-associated flavoprotein CzcO